MREIDSVNVDETGKIKINLHRHRSIAILLEPQERETFTDKLNQLILKSRQHDLELERLRRKRARELKRKSRVRPSSYTTVPYYFPTEQVDIVDKLRQRKRIKK